MHRLASRPVHIALASIGAFAAVVVVQLFRIRRFVFLGHPGFYIHHVVQPAGTAADAGSPLRLLVFGDSTTAGVGVDKPEDSLPSRIAQHLADARRRPVQVTSYGWAGARVADLVRDQVPLAQGPLRPGEREPVLPHADVVVIVIGANDATHRTPPWRFRAALRATLGEIRRAAPEADVVLAGIPVFRGVLRQLEPLILLADQYARVLRRIQRDEAERAAVVFADLAQDATPRLRGRPEVLAADSFHLSAFGYAVWAEVIADALLRRAAQPPAATPMWTEPSGA